MLVAGGGATNAVCLHRARAAALGGFEFACAIPGTAGGGVWMNAGAYGSDWSAIVIRALVATADGTGWLTPAELGLLVPALEPRSTARSSRRSSTGSSRATRARSAPTVRDLVERRKATQPTTKRTFGSVFKNPPGELGAGAMLELCGLKGHRIGGALISPKHANFIENAGGATTADCLALMAEARRRAREQFGVELEHEVVLLGDIDGRVAYRTVGVSPCRTANSSRVATGGRVERGSRPRARAANVVAPLPRRISGERLDLARLVPSGRSLGIAFLIVARRRRRLARSARDGRVRRPHRRRRGGAARPSRRRCARRSPRRAARACSRSTSTRRCGRWRRCRPSRAPASTAPFRTPSASSSCPSGRSRSCAREPTPTSSPRAAG